MNLQCKIYYKIWMHATKKKEHTHTHREQEEKGIKRRHKDHEFKIWTYIKETNIAELNKFSIWGPK